MTALIDADSLVYIIAWNYREMGSEQEVRASCDNFLKDILTIVGADDYIGAFSPPSEQVFRSQYYKYAKYKGNRPPKTECMIKWEGVIKEHFAQAHGFICDSTLEADDILAGVSSIINEPHILCSPDKDLRQVPGKHFDYRAKLTESSPDNPIIEVTPQEAFWNFWTQMLTGDDSDNVAGVPGLGPVKVKVIIEDLKASGEELLVPTTVLQRYRKYFGDYYGTIIFNETLTTLRLMTPSHPLYSFYKDLITMYTTTCRKVLVKPSGFFDVTS
jgi:hypothetical protein